MGAPSTYAFAPRTAHPRPQITRARQVSSPSARRRARARRTVLRQQPAARARARCVGVALRQCSSLARMWIWMLIQNTRWLMILVRNVWTHIMSAKQFNVYLATNTINGKKYVGITIQPIKVRWRQHFLNRTREGNTRLHLAICKYGIDSFNIQHIACAKNLSDLIEIEKVLIVQENSFYVDGHGYNMTRGGEGAWGTIHTPEARAKRGAANRGKKLSLETRAKISDALKGRKISLEQRAKNSAIHKGKTISPDHRAKLSSAHKGRKLSPEHRAKISSSLSGVKRSPEQRRKLSAARKGKKLLPETISKISAALSGTKRKPHSNETRAKISASRMGQSPSPQTRAKLSIARKGQKLSTETRAAIAASKRNAKRDKLGRWV